MKRKSKQAFILFCYITLIVSAISGVFFMFFYQKPTCLDGKQNQDETGIDCGGACQQICLADLISRPLVITNVESLAYGNSSSDAIGTVQNQNTKAALKSATYTFRAYGGNGEVVAEQGGVFSLLPSEKRTLPALGLSAPKSAITKTELTITNEEWVPILDFSEPPDIRVVNPQFALLSGQAGFAEARGLVQNRSPYDIRTLTVVVVVRDSQGRALSVNRTTLNTLQSGEQRDFRLVWPEGFSGDPVTTEMQVHFDMLKEDAFVQQYFPGGEIPREQ